MKPAKILVYSLVAIIVVGLGAYFWIVSKPEATNSKTTNNPLGGVNANNTNQTTLVPAVVMTEKKVDYTGAFGNPNTTTWPKSCVTGDVCFQYDPTYTACNSTIDTEVYLLESGPCQGSQDAPAFVVQLIPSVGQQAVIESAYTRDLTEQVSANQQVRSDEITGQVQGRTLTCYNTLLDRVCKITYSDGTSYSLDGRGYNDQAAQATTKIKNTFDGLVRSMLE